MSSIKLNDIAVSYDGKTDILKNLSLDIEDGKLVSLLGPSGCGKTTTLRVIAGFITPNKGSFYCDQEELTKVPVHKRNFGIVFQSYALFPHLSVFDNVAFGLREQKVPKSEVTKRVNEMLEITDLTSLGDRFPKQLSGGQRQRVALARALVIQPKILLLDEPLSNLDAKLRLSMRVEIKKLQKRLGITTVFVTHDQEECFSISDKVAVMNAGVIEQYDTPEVIYTNPKTEFVARFIGFENFLPLTKAENETANTNLYEYTAANGQIFRSSMTHTKNQVLGTIRPDDIQLAKQAFSANSTEGVIQVRTFLGKSYQYEVQTSLGRFVVNDNKEYGYQTGETVYIYLPANKLVLV